MFKIPRAMAFADLSLLLMRVMLALVFGTSGYSHLAKPKERAASIGMSVPFTVFLGAAEMAGSIALVTGFHGAVGGAGVDPHHAGRDFDEGFQVAHRLLGREVDGLALRPADDRDEPRDYDDWAGKIQLVKNSQPSAPAFIRQFFASADLLDLRASEKSINPSRTLATIPVTASMAKCAGDPFAGIAEGIHIEHVGDGHSISRAEKAEGGGGEWIVLADGFKGDGGAGGDGQALKEILGD